MKYECTNCRDNGWLAVSAESPKEMIISCNCKSKKKYIPKNNIRLVYSSAQSFIDNEDKLKFKSDYPTDFDIMNANGSVTYLK